MSIFNFRKPAFIIIDYSDIIIEDKMLFIVAWKTKNAFRIKILPINKSYHFKEGFAVLNLPSHDDSLSIVAQSFYRSTLSHVHLKKIALDSDTANLILSQLSLKNSLVITKFKAEIVKHYPSIQLIKPSVIIPQLNIAIAPNLNAEKFIYNGT